MYYRVATRVDSSPTWQWKSTTISSLNALFQFLRRYHELPQDHLRVFSCSSHEDMDEQLARENNGLGSRSVTAAQFMQERMISPQPNSSNAGTPASSLHESSRGTYPLHEEASSLQARRLAGAGAERKATSGGDFWNLMTLAKA